MWVKLTEGDLGGASSPREMLRNENSQEGNLRRCERESDN